MSFFFCGCFRCRRYAVELGIVRRPWYSRLARRIRIAFSAGEEDAMEDEWERQNYGR